MFVCLQLLSTSLDGHLAVWDCSDGALLRVRDGWGMDEERDKNHRCKPPPWTDYITLILYRLTCVTSRPIFLREMWFVDCSCISYKTIHKSDHCYLYRQPSKGDSKPKYYPEKKEEAHKLRFDEVRNHKDCTMKYRRSFKKSNHPLEIMVSEFLVKYTVVTPSLLALTLFASYM